MTKSELIQTLAAKNNLAQAQVKAIIDGYSEAIRADLVLNGLAVVHGIGRLKVAARAARLGRNPQTGETFNIPATNTVKLTVTKDLKELVHTHCRFLS